MKCVYSVILPVFNEESCLEDILRRVLHSLDSLQEPYEIICIDDGSTDSSWDIIQSLHKEFPHIKGIKFLRNFGHQNAFYAGIKYCTGEYIALLDADGQDPPEILPQFFAKCREGYDVVYAIREKRKEIIFKRVCYALFYRFYKFIVPFNVPINSGDFSVFNRNVADFLCSLYEKEPFLRGLRSWYGGKQIGIQYERHKRLAGKPKYTLTKLILLAINASITFSKIPLRFISVTGILLSLLSIVCGIYLVLREMLTGADILGWSSTSTLIVFFGGLQLFVLGIIGEYIGNIFDEVKNRPHFLIDQSLGLSTRPPADSNR